MITYSENFTFECNGETIAATIDWNENKDKPTFMSLHGGGKANRERVAYLTKRFASEAGISCIRFDHSGWGESSGEMTEASLKKRTEEALTAIKFMDPEKSLTVMGNSMGGPIAMELTRYPQVKNIILFCPALYAQEAFDVPFDDRFTTILRRENSFLKTDIELLNNYKGKFLHVISEEDTVIPKGVTQTYQTYVTNASERKFIRLPGSEHQLHVFYASNQGEQDKIFAEILELIRK